jgi:hypothetical protein
MKKALMGTTGYIQQIVDPGEDFEIYNGPDATIQWVDAPDNVMLDWTLEWSPAQNTMVWVERDEPFTNREVARKIAYGQVGEQLGMIYDELKETGTLSFDGLWASHITTVKQSIEKPPPAPELQTLEELMALNEVEEPSVEKPAKMSTHELPCWKRYPGWWGNQQ